MTRKVHSAKARSGSGQPDLTPEHALVSLVLAGYRKGWFLMADPRAGPVEGTVEWVQPTSRAIIPLDERFHVPSTLQRRVRSGRFLVTTDRAFSSVIRACAAVRRDARGFSPPVRGAGGTNNVSSESGTETWLARPIIDAFILLHKHGVAHSIEAWLPASALPESASGARQGGAEESVRLDLSAAPDQPPSPHVLVGGLYGLSLGRVFCGESMFHRADLGGTDASKVCLVHLVAHLRRLGYRLLDSQIANAHIAQFGMFEIPRAQYLRQLESAGTEAVEWGALAPLPAPLGKRSPRRRAGGGA